jgi:hypothetical protein
MCIWSNEYLHRLSVCLTCSDMAKGATAENSNYLRPQPLAHYILLCTRSPLVCPSSCQQILILKLTMKMITYCSQWIPAGQQSC